MNSSNVPSSSYDNVASHNKLVKSAVYFSVFTATAILFFKTWGWIISDSQSLMGSLIDTVLDISASVISLIAVRISTKPPDHNHRFGHEKFQDLAIFSQSFFFFAASFFIASSSIKALVNRTTLHNNENAIEFMYICIICTVILITYQTYVFKKTKATIVALDKMHYIADLLTDVVVIFSVKYSQYYWYIDGVCGVLIAVYIGFMSWKFFKQSIKNLADEEFSEEERSQILSVFAKYPNIKGVHELKTRYAAHKPFIQCHIEMDNDLSFMESYLLSEDIRYRLLKIFKHAEIIIHQEPVGVDKDARYVEIIK